MVNNLNKNIGFIYRVYYTNTTAVEKNLVISIKSTNITTLYHSNLIFSHILQIHSLTYKMAFAKGYLFAEWETILVSANSDRIK